MAYEEYPRHLHKAGGAYKIVGNDDEKAAALEAGWSLTPVVEGVTPAPAPQDEAPAPEAAAPSHDALVSYAQDVLAADAEDRAYAAEPAPKPKRGRKPKQ